MKAAVKAFITLFAITLMASVVVGCDQEQNPSDSLPQSTATSIDAGQQKKVESLPKVKSVDGKQAQKVTTTVKQEAESIIVYFADGQGESLVAESRKAGTSTNLSKTAIEQLIAGPQSSDLARTIPEGTRLLNLDNINGVAYVNFSKELIEKHWGGSAMELLTVQSIIDTLTEFDEVKKVQILVDGKTVESIAGHVDISKPLTRDESLIGTP